jgi:hypothetical protein
VDWRHGGCDEGVEDSAVEVMRGLDALLILSSWRKRSYGDRGAGEVGGWRERPTNRPAIAQLLIGTLSIPVSCGSVYMI